MIGCNTASGRLSSLLPTLFIRLSSPQLFVFLAISKSQSHHSNRNALMDPDVNISLPIFKLDFIDSLMLVGTPSISSQN
ncbi:hypothetical protein SASPL_116186 [Salvia splendens]|uniref:Uncharacterized protein n=1 Tax=Salvia splendens TaxID=180675 RepID=A0A8X8XVW0_SALSN|nr:hypothetical protein SASPL_116186 [Salvia splendens]